MSKEKLIIANWKMNLSYKESLKYAKDIKRHIIGLKNIQIVLCPAFVSLPEVIKELTIAENDRLINIKLSKSDILFSIIGGKTNIYFMKDNKVIEQFKKSKSEENIFERIREHNFINEPLKHKVDPKVFLLNDINKLLYDLKVHKILFEK